MSNKEINISKIETWLYSKINKVVSNNTFAGTLPDTTKSEWKDMCLIDLGNSIQDMNAYGQGTALIFLYAKPLSNGTKNVKVLSQLEEKLKKVVDENADPTYMIRRRNTYADYDTIRKWHCNVVELKITIV